MFFTNSEKSYEMNETSALDVMGRDASLALALPNTHFRLPNTHFRSQTHTSQTHFFVLVAVCPPIS